MAVRRVRSGDRWAYGADTRRRQPRASRRTRLPVLLRRALAQRGGCWSSGARARPATRRGAAVTGTTCLWCSRTFTPRRDGGKAQRFCRETCRRSFDAAGRRWIAGAIATGMLTVDTLRNGPAATRALLPGDILPLPIHPAEKPTPVAPAEPRDEA